MTRNRLRNRRPGRKKKKRSRGQSGAALSCAALDSAALDSAALDSAAPDGTPSNDTELDDTGLRCQHLGSESGVAGQLYSVSGSLGAGSLGAGGDQGGKVAITAEDFQRFVLEWERDARSGKIDPTVPMYPENPTGDGPRLSHLVIPCRGAEDGSLIPSRGETPDWDALGDGGPRRFTPDRAQVFRRIERTLLDAEFPYGIEALTQIYRECPLASVFELTSLPIEHTTSPLIAALVDLWNYTPRPPLSEWAPIEVLLQYKEVPAEVLAGPNEGKYYILRAAHFVVSLHNRAFVDSIDLPEDKYLDKELLAAGIGAAQSAGERSRKLGIS